MEKINNKNIVEKLEKIEDLEQAIHYMDDLFRSMAESKNPATLEKISECVNIVKNTENDLVVREVIMQKLLEDFYPFFQNANDVKGSVEDIKQIANDLGTIIEEHEEDDNFKDKCKIAFIETITLNENKE